MRPVFVIRGGLPGLLDALADLHSREEIGVLGIVFDTAGSTYQKAGALVLLGASGTIHGAISGGCLEPQIEDRARTVQFNRRAETIDFDTRSDEDLIFGSGTGCRGRIHLLLLPQGPGAPLTCALHRLASQAAVLEVALHVQGRDTGGGHAALCGESWCWGTDGRHAEKARDSEAKAEANVVLRIAAPRRIVLFGAGPETAPLHAFTQRMGWCLQIVEHRGRWLKFARDAGITDVIELPPADAIEVWRAQHVDAVIAMTHNFELDKQHLAACATTDIPYIGLLGPTARRDDMLCDLGPQVSSQLRGRLRSPVGLGLGGFGPETLALSIAAELQQHFAAGRKSPSPAQTTRPPAADV